MISSRLRTRQAILMVAQAIQRCQEAVPFNKTWQVIGQHLGVGVRAKRELHLSAQDRRAIADYYQRVCGVDLMAIRETHLSASRIDSAQHSGNDKHSPKSVRDGLVLVCSPGGRVSLGEIEYAHPRGGYLVVPGALIAQCRHKILIVIENLSVCTHADQYRWPDEVDGVPLLIYRGDPTYNGAHVLAALKDCPGRIFAFADYDPKGLIIAKEVSSAIGLILPAQETIEAAIREGKNMKQQHYAQHDAAEHLKRMPQQATYVRTLLENKLAISQEYMANRALVLERMS